MLSKSFCKLLDNLYAFSSPGVELKINLYRFSMVLNVPVFNEWNKAMSS